MNNKTILKLKRINKSFYDTIGSEFDSSRQYFWDGWDALLESFPKIKNSNSILDLGCGNGRFYQFWKEKVGEINYIGIDNNSVLLEKAQKNFSDATFRNSDVLDFPILNKKFDLIVAFGVMHHLPSYDLRVEFLQYCKKNLNTEGLVCISIWKFMDDDHEKNKIVPIEDINLSNLDLEENDYFLSWKKGKTAYRYCHYVSEEEKNNLIKDSGLKLVGNFFADGKSGKLNEYLVLGI